MIFTCRKVAMSLVPIAWALHWQMVSTRYKIGRCAKALQKLCSTTGRRMQMVQSPPTRWDTHIVTETRTGTRIHTLTKTNIKQSHIFTFAEKQRQVGSFKIFRFTILAHFSKLPLLSFIFEKCNFLRYFGFWISWSSPEMSILKGILRLVVIGTL